MTVVEFINEYRLFKAVQYFKEGETNIGTVCAKCGFNDVKHFRDLFKRKMNMTPKQYVLEFIAGSDYLIHLFTTNCSRIAQ